MTFDDVAKDIIKDSISNALCIDDSFYEPYSYPENGFIPSEKENYTLSQSLYNSFKKENCILDVHRYSNYGQWVSIKDETLMNKDLVILDWELSDNGVVDTLKVLSDVIKKDNVLFIYIYTRETTLNLILLQILSHLSSFSKSELKTKYIELCQKLERIIDSNYTIVEEDSVDLELLTSSSILDAIKPNMENLMITPNRYSDEYEEIMSKTDLDDAVKNKFYSKLLTYGNQIFNCGHHDTKSRQYLHLFKEILACNQSFDPDTTIIETHTFNWICDESFTFVLDDKLIRIGTKNLPSLTEDTENPIKPEELFSDLSNSISKEPNNFLNLLGLEIRNIFREGSSIVGRDFPTINELAFFHHEKTINVGDNTNFENFLLQLWEDDLSNYVHSAGLKIYSQLPSYKDAKNIEGDLEQINEESLNKNLSKLNYYYCISRSSKKTSRKIEFGDIFRLDTEAISDYDFLYNDTGKKYEYLVCVTQQCDCLRPKKINHMYNFVGGVKLRLKSGLSKVDSDLISFLANDDVENEPFCIMWHFKPFSIYIRNIDSVSDPITGKVCGCELQLQHVDKLKENYAQKIANHVFSDANRVGIDFAKITAVEEKEQ